MTEHGAAVAAVAEEFAAARSGIHDPDQVRGWCEEISQTFVDLLAEHGIAARVVSGLHYGEIAEFPGVRLVLDGHYAVHVPEPAADMEEWLTAGEAADVVYDWTAHQFDPAAAVPTVTTLSSWRETWSPLGGVEASA